MRKNRVLKYCLICGTEIWVKPSHLVKGAGKTCSKECRVKWFSQYMKGRYLERVDKQCQTCGKIFQVKKSHAVTGGIYCSRPCTTEGYKSSMKGAGNPNWKNGQHVQDQPGYWTGYSRARRARVRGARGSHTAQEWSALKAFYNYTCLCCGRQEPDIELTLDHVVPLYRGGSNSIDNAQPLCRSCNSSKGTQSTDYRKQFVLTYQQLALF